MGALSSVYERRRSGEVSDCTQPGSFTAHSEGYDDQPSIVTYLGNLGKPFLRCIDVLGELADTGMSADLAELERKVVALPLDNMSSAEGAGASSEKEELREQIALMSATDTAAQYIEQGVPPLHIPEFQSLMDDWSKEDGIPYRQGAKENSRCC